MNTNPLYMNNLYLRPPSNFLLKERRDQRSALEAKTATPPMTLTMAMAMAMAADISIDGGYSMHDCNSFIDESADKDSFMHLPPALERQRSSSPRSVSGIWSSVYSEKGGSNVAAADSDDDDDTADCLVGIDPLPLATSVSLDLLHLMQEHFNHDVIKEILPKTKLTFYTDREHKIDDVGMDEIEDDMKDAQEKTDQFLERRKLLDDFPLTNDSGEEDDPFKFFATNVPTISESPKVTVENHNQNCDGDTKTTKATKASTKKKTTPASKAKTSIKRKTSTKRKNSIKTKPSIKRKTPIKKKPSIMTKPSTKDKISIKDKMHLENKKPTKVTKKVATKASQKTAPASKKTASIKKKKKKIVTPTMPIVDKYAILAAKKEAEERETMKQAHQIIMKAELNSRVNSEPNVKKAKSLLVQETWNLNYRRLKTFYAKNKHSCVLRSDPDTKLSGWVKRQRNNLRSGKLTPDQIQRLEDVDFCWNRIEHAWYHKCSLLEQYAKEHGTASVKTSKSRVLAEWAQRQRREYHSKKKTLTQTRIQKLEAIPGWQWKSSESRK